MRAMWALAFIAILTALPLAAAEPIPVFQRQHYGVSSAAYLNERGCAPNGVVCVTTPPILRSFVVDVEVDPLVVDADTHAGEFWYLDRTDVEFPGGGGVTLCAQATSCPVPVAPEAELRPASGGARVQAADVAACFGAPVWPSPGPLVECGTPP